MRQVTITATYQNGTPLPPGESMTVELWPLYRRQEDGSILNNRRQSHTFTGSTTVTLDTTTPDWVWVARLTPKDMSSWVEYFPLLPGEIIDYTEIPKTSIAGVDPDDVPQESWWAYARAAIIDADKRNGHLVITRADGTETDLGRVDGLPGATGHVPTLKVSETVTVDPDTPANVTRVQSPLTGDYTDTFTIPRGEQGEPALGTEPQQEVIANWVAGDNPVRAALNAQIGDSPIVVYHGAEAWHPRPDTTRPVMWIGTATPGNRRDGDLHLPTSSEPAPFAPDWLDLIGWYDATDEAYETDTVNTLHDKSGRGVDLDLAANATPLSTTTTALPNRAWDFTGASWFDSGDIGAGTWRNPTTVYMAVNIPASSVNRYLMSGTSPYAGLVLNPRRAVSAFQGANLWTPDYTVPDSTPAVIAAKFTGGDQSTVEINGVLRAGPGATGSWVPQNIRIGALHTDANPLTAAIGEIIIAREVTSTEHNSVTAYLMDKWGAA